MSDWSDWSGWFDGCQHKSDGDDEDDDDIWKTGNLSPPRDPPNRSFHVRSKPGFLFLSALVHFQLS